MEAILTINSGNGVGTSLCVKVDPRAGEEFRGISNAGHVEART
jgi:hypothetical protein